MLEEYNIDELNPRRNPYAKKIKNVALSTWFSLNDEQLLNYCKNFITTGDFMETWLPFIDNKSIANKKATKPNNKKTNKTKK